MGALPEIEFERMVRPLYEPARTKLDLMLGGENASRKFEVQCVRVYVVRSVLDEMGRTGGIVGVYATPEQTLAGAKGYGGYGPYGEISEAVGLLGPDGYVYLVESGVGYEMNTDIPKSIDAKRKAALAKLTPEEIALLGVKPK